MEHISIFIAFLAGLLSFLSPCVLPLIPGYISFICGLSIDEISSSCTTESKGINNMIGILLSTGLFILGFSFVFVALGASVTYISSFLFAYKNIIQIILGIIVLAFGIHLTGLFSVKFLQYEKRFHINKKPVNILSSFLIGVAFAFGWTPCIGPILGSILGLASTKETVSDGIILLSFYSLGLAIPFILTSITIGSFFAFFNKAKRYFKAISVISGILLIGVGIYMIIGCRL